MNGNTKASVLRFDCSNNSPSIMDDAQLATTTNCRYDNAAVIVLHEIH